MAYTAKAASSTVEGSSAGKNTGPMIVANAPYKAKSYHCTALPRQSGRTAVGVTDASRDFCQVLVADMTVRVVPPSYRRRGAQVPGWQTMWSIPIPRLRSSFKIICSSTGSAVTRMIVRS